MVTIYTTDPHSSGQAWIDKVEHMHQRYPKAQIVFGGDYIDGRGPIDPKTTLEYVIQMQQQYHAIVLKGNHEQMMFNFMDHQDPLWFQNGGKRTSKCLLNRGYSKAKTAYFLNQIKIQNVNLYHWLAALPYVYQNQDGCFVHAYVHLDRPINDAIQSTTHDQMLWSRQIVTWDANDEYATSWVANHTGVPLIVGHTPTMFLTPATAHDDQIQLIPTEGNPIIRDQYPDCQPIYACDTGAKNHQDSDHSGTVIVFDHGKIIDLES